MRWRGEVRVDLGSFFLDRIDARAVAGTPFEVVDVVREPVAGADGDVTVVVAHQQAGVVTAADGQGGGDADGRIHLVDVRALIDDLGQGGENRRRVSFLPARHRSVRPGSRFVCHVLPHFSRCRQFDPRSIAVDYRSPIRASHAVCPVCGLSARFRCGHAEDATAANLHRLTNHGRAKKHPLTIRVPTQQRPAGRTLHPAVGRRRVVTLATVVFGAAREGSTLEWELPSR